MRKGNFEGIRQKAVADYMDVLKHVERADAPRWLLTLMIIPVWLWESIKVVFRFTTGVAVVILSGLVASAAAPFIGLYAMLDTLWVMTWFFRRILDKMTGEE